MPRIIGTIVSSRLATLADLSERLGVEDAHDLLEILKIDAHNRRVVDAARARDR